jgi:hypothetical protein
MPSPYPVSPLLIFGEVCELFDPAYTLIKHFPVHLAHYVFTSMAPVVCIEPNGSQTLLLFDNAREDLENSGWLVFIQIFEGFNLSVAQ